MYQAGETLLIQRELLRIAQNAIVFLDVLIVAASKYSPNKKHSEINKLVTSSTKVKRSNKVSFFSSKSYLTYKNHIPTS